MHNKSLFRFKLFHDSFPPPPSPLLPSTAAFGYFDMKGYKGYYLISLLIVIKLCPKWLSITTNPDIVMITWIAISSRYIYTHQSIVHILQNTL
jgi:hypothetical protein